MPWFKRRSCWKQIFLYFYSVSTSERNHIFRKWVWILSVLLNSEFIRLVTREKAVGAPSVLSLTKKCGELRILYPVFSCGSWSLRNNFILCWAAQLWTPSPISHQWHWCHSGLPLVQGMLWNPCTRQDCSSQSTDWCTAPALLTQEEKRGHIYFSNKIR